MLQEGVSSQLMCSVLWGLGGDGGKERKSRLSLNGDPRLIFLFLVCCLPLLPLVLSHKGTDWSEGRAPSNPFCAMRSKSTVHTSTELPKLLCCLASSFH